MTGSCCFRDCSQAAQTVDISIKVWPPSDAPALILHAHSSCFENARSPGVEPDDAQKLGRIPAGARCVICGKRLPLFGQHPYAIEVLQESNPNRFWVHAQCFEERFIEPAE